LLDGLGSRVVILLRSLDHFAKVKLPARLTPVLNIQGQDFLLETPKMGAMPLRALKTPVSSLLAEQARIAAALDFLFQGY
jgi:toxin CcdB